MVLTKEDLNSIKDVIKTETGPIKTDLDLVKKDFLVLRGEIKDIVKAETGPIKADVEILRQEMNEFRHDLNALREQIQQLTITLDAFLKRMTDHEEEFTILKGEVRQIKQILKEKLGVEIRGALGW